VAQFIEKPPLDLAQQFVASGDYYWNSGMFVFKAEPLSGGAGRLRARYSAGLDRGASRRPRRTWISCASTRPSSKSAAASRSTMRSWRKPRMRVVLPLDAGWSDVGSWSSLFDALPADEEGNVLQGDVLVHDTHDCYVHSTSRLVAAVGMDDHIIVETKDAVLVAPKERVQDVKELVAKLKKSGRSESSCIARCSGPGAATTASTTASASRSSACR
jgi:mannose-1-phosphate guanylyltransferase/mannose-6-phosphate isomerase